MHYVLLLAYSPQVNNFVYRMFFCSAATPVWQTFRWHVSAVIHTWPLYLNVDTYGYRIAGPRRDGNPGGRNTERNPRCSGTCDHNRH